METFASIFLALISIGFSLFHYTCVRRDYTERINALKCEVQKLEDEYVCLSADIRSRRQTVATLEREVADFERRVPGGRPKRREAAAR
ncbi:putative RNase H-like nuclease (RuvC/YqgF family) [Desulfobaculum xiamenense]|uniref:Putative RNase H-like nuclease (RuvC/YqgF family) n=1 Tax=Desulfobaculum xiamenense TaxID=995050 RepID=A0A846QTX1_9BACT|nr:hypothetical protein [Desulfobaculum xiamenense]NJB68614.1 putative RNase H-like nuclease (RuvC/YqgF family) [Desulfobaculum xiamenense]